MMKIMASLALMGMLLLGVACTPTVPATAPVSPTASTGDAGHSTPTLPVVTEEPSPQTAQFFLIQSDLQVQSATMEGGQAVVHLSGTMMLGGVCDNPRVQAQLEETARQFSPTGQVAVFVNDVPLADVLSLR